jgi:hypothetical protein
MAACAAGRQPAAGKDRLLSGFATAVRVGLLGVLASVPARPVSSACPVHQQRLRPGGGGQVLRRPWGCCGSRSPCA